MNMQRSFSSATVADRRSVRARGRRFGLSFGLAVVAMLGTTASAGAVGPPPGSEYGIASFVTEVKDRDGNDETRAAAHPHSARAAFEFNTYDPGPGVAPEGNALSRLRPVEDPRSLSVRLPAGFVGNPQVAGTCPMDTVGAQTNAAAPTLCPEDSFVGFVRVRGLTDLNTVVVNVAPEDGYPAEFGFSEAALTFTIYPELRSDGDYGVNMNVPAVNLNFMRSIDTTFCSYGVDMDFIPNNSNFRCREKGEPGAFEKPFLTNPASECPAEPPVTVLETDSWRNPGVFKTATAVSPLITSCATLRFEPSVDIAPSTTLPDAPTGLNVDMAFPQEDNDQGQAPAALKKAVVTLPEGVTINPSGAGGLQACSDGELLLKSKDPMSCPEASKVGSVVARSPLLEEEIEGGVYIRSQNSRDPESGEMFRLALVLQNKKRGIDVRLPGQIRVNKQTGRIETTFDNNPELPVESLKLTFKDGPRAPLATPASCGPKTSDIVLTSWGGQTKTIQSTFNVSCLPGLGAFGPGFNAGTKAPVAGASSPFNLLMTRADGHDVINGLTVEMPEGLLANLKGNVGTQIGTVTADAGPGSHPYRFPGKVFLEGPYKDAPFSLKVVIPAKAGPFDLGEVVVRQRILVDPKAAQVTVVSDPIPTIVEGVPVRLRNMSVDVDKPGFMLNPTSCDEKRIEATAHSLGGKSANVASRFQVGGCAALPLKPKMSLALTGAKETGYHKHPGLSAEVTQTPGESGLKKVTVSLPLSLALDPDNARALCKPEQAVAKACPEGSIIGDATAVSPVLNRPLTGHVYFVEGLRTSKTGRVIKTLPKLWVALRGEVALDVWADSAVKDRRLVNTFATVPDAPISSFNLNIKGGENGILKVTGKQGNTLCKGNQVADARFDGQNGKQLLTKTSMSTPCGFKAVSSSLGSASARVTVGGLGKGRLTLSGDGIRRTSRSVSSEVVTVNALLSQAGRRASRGNRPVKVKVAFAFKPKHGKAKTVTVSVKRSKAKKGAARR